MAVLLLVSSFVRYGIYTFNSLAEFGTVRVRDISSDAWSESVPLPCSVINMKKRQLLEDIFAAMRTSSVPERDWEVWLMREGMNASDSLVVVPPSADNAVEVRVMM